MNDRHKLSLFQTEGSYINQYKHFRAFTSDALLTDKLHISILAMDLPDISMKDRKKMENEWLEKLPSLDNVKALSIRHKVNQEFFEKICEMKNLESLSFWTSTVEDLNSLKRLKGLYRLYLDSFSRLKDISVLANLKSITVLSIENCFKVDNYKILGAMTQLEGLPIRGYSFGPKNLRLKSLRPFSHLKNLRHLDLCSTSVIDNSYESILEMNSLERFDITNKIPKETIEEILTNHKTLKAGMFTDWDWENNKMRADKQW